jgi:hypothetical protein
VACRRTVRDVPPDFGPLIGQPAFEQARGVVMEVCDCADDRAIVLLTEFVRRTDGAPEDLVATLRTPSSRAELRRLFEADST